MLIKIRLLGAIGLTVPTPDTPLLAQTAPAGPFCTEAEAVRHQAAFMVAAKQAGYTLRPAFFYRNRPRCNQNQGAAARGSRHAGDGPVISY